MIAEGKGGDPYSKNNPANTQAELLEREQNLEHDLHELRGDMEKNVKGWTHDFMNLVFGHSEEKNLFWEQIVLPKVAQYYVYFPLEDL